MLHRRAPLLFFVAGCSSAPAPIEQASTDVVIEEPQASSGMSALGVTEAVSGAAGGERAIRAVAAEISACVKPLVEREPALSGTMTFRIEPGAATKPATGTLAALPAAACVRDALAAVKGSGAIEYTLTLKGNPQPPPLPAGAVLSDDWVAVDWTGADPPAAFAKSSEALRERFRRCAFAAEPLLSEKVWLAARVAKGGAVTVGLGKPGDASDCIQRALRTTAFPDAGHDYAFSVMLRPLSQQEVAEAENDKQEFGMIGLLNAGAGSVEGDAFGAGGLGLTGIGTGGGGTGTGIGIGGIGTLVPSSSPTTGPGFGGGGRLGTAQNNPPRVRMGATSVAGRLPPEVIQRIVRQNFGRFRLCYENGLRKDANLTGKVSVSFEITRQGTTSKVSSTSDLKDKGVASCVEKTFTSMTFPQPEGGVVKVTYPIMFSPGDSPAGSAGGTGGAPAKPAAPPPRTIDGKPLANVSLVDVEKRLLAKGFEVARVPGSGDPPALFINDEPNRQVYALTLEPQRAGMRGPVCKAGGEERQLHVRGYHCERVMEPLFD